jgi:hypothetical protein
MLHGNVLYMWQNPTKMTEDNNRPNNKNNVSTTFTYQSLRDK